MIALFMLVALATYFTISFFIVRGVYEYFDTKKSKYIAIVIMILIPTWDVILGYPIYKLLCYTSAGVHIYKTVDNIEGFYVGKKDSKFEPHEPYEGYKYIDYKEMNHYKTTGKYYRSYWIDSNTSKDCIHYGEYKFSNYADAYRSGKCIVKKEITEGEVSELWSLKREVSRYMFFYLNIYRVDFTITNRKNSEKYFTVRDYFVDDSWITGLGNMVSGNKHKRNCFKDIIVSTSSGFQISDLFILKILKTKKEEI